MYQDREAIAFGLPLNTSGAEILKKYCPTMDPSSVCCDDAQLRTMDSSIALAANFLKRCPSCMSNLVQSICQLTCSPHQSTFMDIKKNNTDTETNVTYITEVDYYITQQYMDKTYNSCQQVSVPATGQLAMDFMCGDWGALRCTANRWFTYMGTAGNNSVYVPFQINYINSTTAKVGNFTPMDIEITPCNKPLNSDTPACSCVDCEDSCPVPPPDPPKPQPFHIAGFEGMSFLMLVVFVIGSIVFLLIVFMCSAGRTFGSEEMRAAVGRRLASAEFHSSQVALGDASAGENSPLQSSHRSSTSKIIFNTNQSQVVGVALFFH
ncbi:hypothetical protein YQE_12055, partial [Dendroctonus ponderosae]